MVGTVPTPCPLHHLQSTRNSNNTNHKSPLECKIQWLNYSTGLVQPNIKMAAMRLGRLISIRSLTKPRKMSPHPSIQSRHPLQQPIPITIMKRISKLPPNPNLSFPLHPLLCPPLKPIKPISISPRLKILMPTRITHQKNPQSPKNHPNSPKSPKNPNNPMTNPLNPHLPQPTHPHLHPARNYHGL